MQDGSDDRVYAQHIGLRRLLLSIRELLATVGRAEDESWPAQQQADAVALLCDLERELGRHFALEERVGPLAAALRAAPHLAARSRGLMEEHAGLREEVAKLAALARTAGARAADWQQVELEFRAFASALVAHERLEDEIIWSAWTQDRGGGG